MRSSLILVLLLCGATFASCGDDGGASAPASPEPTQVATPGPIMIPAGDPIVIGVSAALSGDAGDIGSDLALAAQMAVEAFGGTVAGHPISVSPRDDACMDPEQAVGVANLFIADSTLTGVVGPMCTVGAQAANPLYAQAGIIHISPSAARVELSRQGDAYFFRTAWHDDAQAALQARYLIDDLDGSTALVVDDGEPYGVALADAFEAAYSADGGDILDRLRIERGTTDFSAEARQVLAAAPSAVVFEGLNPEGGLFVKALREAGYTGVFMGPDGLLSIRDFIPTAGTAAEGAVLTGGPVADAAFVEQFVARAGRPPSTAFVLQSHDAVTALLRAIDATATEQADGSLSIDRAALAKALRAGRFAGLTGSITFDEYGDRRGETAAELGLRVYRIENSGLVLVE